MKIDKLKICNKFVMAIMIIVIAIASAFYMVVYTDNALLPMHNFMKHVEKNFWNIIMYASLVAMIVTLVTLIGL